MTERTALINDDKIELVFDAFTDGLLEVVRNIPGRRWNDPAHPGMWTVPYTPWHCWKVMDVFKRFGFWFDPTIQKCADKTAPQPVLDLELPEGLYKFQAEGVSFIYQAGGRAILGDAPGVGKTAQALVVGDKFAKKVLVVCPSNVLWKWKREAGQWAPSKTAEVIQTGKSKLTKDDIHIMSFGIMVSKLEELRRVNYDLVIIDEAHALKNYKTLRTKAAKKLIGDGIPHVLFLTGTPLLNRPIELFTLLEMLDEKTWGNWVEFVVRYCNAQKIDGHWFVPPNGATNLDELGQRLNQIMIRRTKMQVNTQLPKLTRSYLPVDLDNMAEYKEAKRDVLKWMRENRGNTRTFKYQNVLVKMNILRQVAGKGKVAHAIELAESILEGEERVVLFAHHKEVVSMLEKGLRKYGVGLIVGGVPPKKRDELVKNFLNPNLSSKEKIRVMICSTAGAEGIDLYSAFSVIFVEREWTPALEEQMEARLHRNGQKNPVTAYYLIGNKTIDEHVGDTVYMKRDVVQQIISQDSVIEQWLEEEE